MSESQEIEAAAATGAAAAVREVQDQQQQEESTARAEVAAEVAAETAAEAAQEASTAVQTSATAVEAATTAQEQTEQVAAAAAIGLSDVHERVGAVERKQDEFIQEVRDFFEKLTERSQSSGEVQTVEVGHASQSNTSAENTSEATANSGSQGTASTTGDKPRRHRWGASLYRSIG